MASAHTGCVHVLRPKFSPIPFLQEYDRVWISMQNEACREKKKNLTHVSTSISLQFKHSS